MSSYSSSRVLRAAACMLAAGTSAAAMPQPLSADANVNAGYHVIYSYAGTTVPSELTTLATQGKVGGVILFGDNIDNYTPQHMEALQAAYKSSSAYAGSPLLIMTDQEGGEVKRLPGGPTESEKEIGESSDPVGGATTAGEEAAATLKNYQNNANLAPVADVFHQAGDFDDQYQRSYSNNSNIAAECVSAFVKAQQAAGVLATAKHFPGLGGASASQDTDAEPVTINISINSLRASDEVPFQAGISAGIDMIMASWALYPSFDATYPAGISSKWIQSELRGRLGFQGVTITDAIEAGGLNNFGTDSNHRAILATVAGMDLILAAARDPSQGEGIVSALATAVSNGTISSSAFNAASSRILAMRSKLN